MNRKNNHDSTTMIIMIIPKSQKRKEEVTERYTRERAFQLMDELREKANLRLATDEIIKLKNYGRE